MINTNRIIKAGLLLVAIFQMHTVALAQLQVPFSPRFSDGVYGDFLTIGNNMLSTTATGNYTGTEGNHNLVTVFVDIDADNTTFNSSSANLTGPIAGTNCIAIKKAYLYWAAADYEEPNVANEPVWNYNDVKLMLPGSATYTTITADNTIFRGRTNHFVNDPYVCFKDITSIVQALGSPYGKYQVANVRTKKGSLNPDHTGGNVGTSGGWQIIFIYEGTEIDQQGNSVLPAKFISVFDGYANVTSSQNNYNITISGFQTPPVGAIQTKIMFGSLEGDRDLSGDQFQIRNVANSFVNLTTGANRPTTNFFNSRVSVENSDFLDRNPASTNTLGYDIGYFTLNNPSNTIINNNQTSAVFRLTSNQETYGLYMIGFSTDVWAPDLSPLLQISSPSNVNPGDTIYYTFTVKNNGNDDAKNIVITRTLPPEVELVEPVSPLPVGVTYSYNAGTRVLSFYIQNGLADINDPPINISYKTIVKNQCYFLETACVSSTSAQLLATYTGTQNPATQTTLSSNGITGCGLGNDKSNSTSINPPTPANWATAAGALNRVVNCNDAQALAVAQALFPLTDKCNFTLNKLSGSFVSDICPTIGTYTNTWTFTDKCGRTSPVFTQVITVQDTTKPVITGTPQAITVSCASDVPAASIANISATDNCNGTVTKTVTDVISNQTCSNRYTITRTWTATDACGNSSTSTQLITVNDTIKPTFTSQLPADIIVDCNSIPQAATLSATDNCGQATVTLSESTTVGGCSGAGGIIRTWTATDTCGNTSTHIQNITVQDTTKPVITGTPQAITVSCASDVPAASIANISATDNCNGTVTKTVADVISNQTCSNRYTITRTWTATDACGNSSTSTQLITVNDTIKPTFTSQLPTDIIVDCNSIPQAATVSATDNCGQATVTLSESTTIGGCSGAGGIIRTWTATDACGNTSIHIQNITVQDTTKPVITGTPQAITVSCASDVPAASIGNISATDNCNGTVTKTVADVITNQTCNNRYTITRTWTATDACGNSSSSIQLITVNDTIKPTFTSQLPADIIVDCNSIPQAATLSATDNCGQATVTLSESTTVGGCSGAGGIIRTWTATDACGNTSIHIQNITVQDTTKPVITGTPQAITVSCASDVPAASIANISATDNCNGTVTKTVADVITNQTCNNRYTITRTWTATDACGNSSTSSQLITVNDTIKPTFTSQLPADIIVDCNSIPQAATLSATDNCGQATVTLSESTTVGGCSGAGGIIRTWTATDACGNTSIHIQNITVQDTTKPVITGTPQAITVSCATDVPVASIANISATDNCNGTVTKTVADVISNQTCSNRYTITRTWTATDACGNSSSSIQLITVNDTIKPTFTSQLPADIIVDCNSIPQAATLSATDNCGQATVTLSESTTVGGCSGAGGIIRTWTATDACGNTSIHIQNITVQDTTKPVITGTPQAITVSCASDVPAASIANISATDNCNGTVTKTVVDVITNQTCSNRYTITRTWTATDACGNSSSSIQLITVNDTIKPTFTSQLPADIIVDCNSIPQAATLSATDNCGQATVTLSESTTVGGCSGAGGIIRTWTATDACGNTSIHIQNITVQDTTKPVITGTPQAITVSCATDVPVASIANISATDNCNGTVTKTVADVISNQTCSNRYTITRTWTATDACGNSSTSTQLITVNDTIKPTFTSQLPADIIVNCNSIPQAATLSATDNCGQATVTLTESTTVGGCSGAVGIIRTWTATDACGNTRIHIQNITVQDTTKPVITGTPQAITVSCASEVPAASIDNVSTTDNCSGIVTKTVADVISNQTCSNRYTITRTWTATDACGNSSSSIQLITVNDTIKPTFTSQLPADIIVDCNSIPQAATLSATDNCGQATVTLSESTTVGGCSGAGGIIRTWTATDACGNTSIHIQNITVQDTTKPVITGTPQAITVSCASEVPAASIDNVSTTDNCSGIVTKTVADVISNQTCSNRYTITRTWTATDACGNSSSSIQLITVNDTIKPTFTSQLPADIIVDCNSIPQAATVTATDNCGQATVTLSESTTVGGCSGAGGIIRTWTATDACGNIRIHIQNITVQDTTKPVITGTPQDITVSCAADVPAASIANISATDNCNGTVTKTVADVITNQTCSNRYTITRTWTATDACGNSSSSIQLITVNDTIPPLIEETPRDIILSCETDVPEASISSVIVIDNCSSNISITVIDETENQTCSNDFTIIRTWTAIDECGNSSTSKQIIKVRDTIKPIILSIPDDVTISCTEEIPTASINAITATDNCRGNLSIEVNDIFGNQTCEHKFTITRTWIVSDICGNSAIASQIITVNDSINPIIADIPQDITVSCASDVPVANSSTVTVTDNCVGTITQTVVDLISNEICANKYTIRRIWTATDTCGNSSIAEQKITVNDSINPVFVEALPQDMIVCKDVPNAPIITATDNCGAATVRFTETIDSFSTPNIRIYTRIWTATDVCQNITTHRQIITVLPVVQTLITREICEGRYVELGNNSYGLSGTYHAVFESAQGCDSIVILTLKVNPVKQTNIDAVICSGEQILVGDLVFTESVTNELIYLETSKGCDSIVVLNLIVLNSDTTTTNRAICNGDRVEIGGVIFTSSGTYFIPFQNNQCNGIVQLNLTVLQPTTSNITLNICEDEVVTVAGQVYSESGIYLVTTQNALGCDSIITLNLNVKQQTNSILDKTICYGESFTIGNQTFNTSGSYVVIFSNTAGCDSTVLLNLNVIGQNDTLRISRTICEGETTIIEDQEFNEDGIYYVAIENGRCSAMVELTLTVNATSTTILNEVICIGEAMVIGNQTFTNEGNYSVILQNSTGCDSIVTLNLQVSDGGNKTILDTTICYGEIYKYGDQSFSTTGTFQLIYPVDNCRDTVLINLLVNPISTAAIDTAIFDCQGGLLIGGQLFNEAGVYQIPLTNSLGCDSIITLNLRIRLCDTIPLGQEITIYDTLPVQTTISICDLSLPPGNNVVVEACSGTTSGTTTLGTWTINNQNNCLEYTAGQILGNDTLCMNACDTVTRQCDITTVIITITGLPPVANDDCVEETEKNTEINIDVTANDTDPDLDELFIESIISPPQHGTATIQQNDQTISYMPNKNFCGRDTFYYEVCDGNDGCDTAMVCIEIKCECVLPQVITPNNDGFNDNLFFPCIGSVEGARLLVWHRWGLIVYEDNNYKNDWQGTLKGELLPAGTYWYSIEYKDRETQQDVKEVNYFMIIN